jgi:hypothetical protein
LEDSWKIEGRLGGGMVEWGKAERLKEGWRTHGRLRMAGRLGEGWKIKGRLGGGMVG